MTRFLKVGVHFVVLFKWVQYEGNLARLIKIICGTIDTKLSISVTKKKINPSKILKKLIPAKFCLLFKGGMPLVVLSGYNF